MNGLLRITSAIKGKPSDKVPVMPILHSGLPPIFGISMAEYFSDARTMSDTIIRGYHKFGYDGVQLSLGVTGEAQALGAEIEQPADAAPVLKKTLLANIFDTNLNIEDELQKLGAMEPAKRGRMPQYFEAVARTNEKIGKQAFILSMLRGPLLIASQLCGVEALLIALIEKPEQVKAILAFTTELAIHLGAWLINSGAHGLMLGEATCSPNFISPTLYRTIVKPFHKKLVNSLKQQGWSVVGLHICGNIALIFEDMVQTGADLIDVDYQVPAIKATNLSVNRVTLRGNLDPSQIFRFGTPDTVTLASKKLIGAVQNNHRWILSSGCDIPPGTPEENITAFIRTRDE